MPTLAAPLDFAKLEGRNIRIHILSSAPSSPVSGQMYYNSTDNTLYWYDANLTTWVTARGGGAPAAHATSHQPGGSDPMAVDAAAASGSLRTLGTGASQAAAGNDSRFSDSRAPTGAAGGDLTGSTYPNPVVAALAITDAKVATANKDGVAGTASMRTIGTGAQQSMAGNTRLDTIAAPTGSVSLNSQKIINLLDPASAQDAATKNYVDGLVQGLDSHPSVRVATTASVTTIAGGAPNTVDSVSLAANDRILVKDQAAPAQNGIYTVQTLGTGANGTWVRATDQDIWAEVPSAYVWVEIGTVNADTGWTCTSDAGGTIGTTAINWTQFSSAGAAIAGAGLTKTGNTLDVVGTTNRISVAADSVDIDSGYVGQTSITTVGTIANGTWGAAATPIAVASGGTGNITQKSGRETGLAASGYYSSSTHGAGTTISITAGSHGLRANAGLIVQCQIAATGAVILPDVAIDGSGNVTITFSVSQSANTIRTTIIG